ncbi:MAG: ribosome biogenesis GTPase YlqF [Firmicutes bacterium]|nr:ribosome biogenesis GTPase YlqF [Bacillota bacterium]
MKNNNQQNQVNINWYPGHMAKAKRLIKERLDLIDVVYELVDARIPFSSKLRDMDEVIGNKPRLLIMTKADLCDRKETQKWISYYEKLGNEVVLIDGEKKLPMNEIMEKTMELMKDVFEKREKKGLNARKARVLVIGIPNVGKSTFINRIVGKKAVNVGNKPGVTKTLDWIRINENIELMDSPGILWPKLDDNFIAFNLASLTAIKEEILPLYDVIVYLLETLYQYYPEVLKERYGIEELDEDPVETLEKIGKRRGCVIRGGEIDYEKVYSVILTDIKNGAIKNITFDRFDERMKELEG